MPPTAPNIEGKWAMIRAELSGEKAPELVVQKTELELKAGTYTVRFDGQVMDHGTYELGATTQSTTMIFKGESGPNAGRTIPCIWRGVGDRLQVCYGLDGVAPTAFETAPSMRSYLALYKRT